MAAIGLWLPISSYPPLGNLIPLHELPKKATGSDSIPHGQEYVLEFRETRILVK